MLVWLGCELAMQKTLKTYVLRNYVVLSYNSSDVLVFYQVRPAG